MKIADIIKLLFTGIKPVKELIGTIKEGGKTGWSSPAFLVTVVGSLVSFVLAVKSILPGAVAAIIIAALMGLYNALRAYINTQQEGVTAPLKSTRFWTTVAGVALVALTDIKTAGVGGTLMTTLISVLTAVGTVSQSVGSAEPSDEETRS